MSPAAAVVWFSILIPVKGWVTPTQPLAIEVDAPGPITLVLTDFTGKPLDPEASAEVSGKKQVDLKQIYNEASMPGTFVLYAVPKGMDVSKFVGTPLVIDVRDDTRREAAPGPMVTRVEPLRYARISTDKGDMTAVFYYDVAPATVDNFISLAMEGFYDGLSFFRIVPGMLIQTGDPRGDGTGGPGFHVEAEFSNRQHIEGTMSMARQLDPIEKQGALPRSDFANSAGSQFFICLDYNNTKQLDRRFSGFGRVVGGQEVMKAIGSVEVANETPKEPPIVTKIEILPVKPNENPYGEMMSFAKPVVVPATAPTK